jgi:replicative DNA helicase
MSTALVPVDHDDGASALNNREAEFSLLCTLIRDRSALEMCADRLTQDDFSDPFLGRMFLLMVHEVSAGRTVNPITLRPMLEEDPSFAHFGGPQALFEMGADSLSLLYDWKGLLSDISRFAKRRRIIAALYKAVETAHDVSGTDEALIDAVDAAVGAGVDGHASETVKSVAAWARDYIDNIDSPMPPGILCSRVTGIDQAIGSIRKGDLVIGAGRPGMGKTATALSYAIGAAQNGNGTLIISLEMGAPQLIERMFSDISHESGQGVPYNFIRNRELDPFRKREVCRAAERLGELPLHICDASGLTIPKLERMIRRYRRRMEAKGQSLDLVIVDYLQLMSSAKPRENKTAEVTEISNGLKRIAKSQNVGMFVLSQLSREVERRPDKRPVLSDLRDSGSIEQDADAVLFFFRLEYYLRQSEPLDHDSVDHVTWRENLQRCTGRIDFICAKRRAGEANVTRHGQFHAEYQAVR